MERSRRSDRRYFYDWGKFADVREFNKKLKAHLSWSSNRAMRSLGRQSFLSRLATFPDLHHLQTQKKNKKNCLRGLQGQIIYVIIKVSPVGGI